jgi:hypothetical protein
MWAYLIPTGVYAAAWAALRIARASGTVDHLVGDVRRDGGAR